MRRQTKFLDLPPELSGFNESKVAILSLPYEATTSYGKGTKAGPEAIIQASTQVEFYDEELDCEPCQAGISTVRPFTSFPKKPEVAVGEIKRAGSNLLARNKFVVGLGGEHTVTVGLVRAMTEKYPGLSVLQLDAHSDLRDTYEGTPFSHACVMRRILEMCSYVGLGIRSSIPGQRKILGSDSHIFYAHEMIRHANWPDWILGRLGNPVYVTIDLDFFDPSLVPSVGTPEPGGFQWYETLSLLREISTKRTIVGFDVVELTPQKYAPASDFIAAKLVYKLLGYIFTARDDVSKKKNLDY